VAYQLLSGFLGMLSLATLGQKGGARARHAISREWRTGRYTVSRSLGLCRSSFLTLQYSTNSYRVFQNKRAPGSSSRFVIQQRFGISQSNDEIAEKTITLKRGWNLGERSSHHCCASYTGCQSRDEWPRIHDATRCTTGCTTGCTTRKMSVYTIQPVL